MNTNAVKEAEQLIDSLRVELRLYGLFGRPIHLGHVERGLESLSDILRNGGIPQMQTTGAGRAQEASYK
jgi:hypothetical protein